MSKFRSLAVILLFPSLLCGASLSQATDDLDKTERTLKIISEFANSICNNIPLNGGSSSFELSGSAKAELSKLLKKVTDLGFQGGAKYQSAEYEGLLQKDLITALKDSANCKQNVSKDLNEKLLSKPVSNLGAQGTISKWSNPDVSAGNYGRRWISLLDQSRIREAYEALDKDQKTAYTLEEFQDQLSRAWKPKGMLVSRTLIGSQPLPRKADTPPDSKFFMVAFRTKWEHNNQTGTPGDEVVILRLSRNGKWQVARYICLACPSAQ